MKKIISSIPCYVISFVVTANRLINADAFVSIRSVSLKIFNEILIKSSHRHIYMAVRRKRSPSFPLNVVIVFSRQGVIPDGWKYYDQSKKEKVNYLYSPIIQKGLHFTENWRREN